MRPAEALDIHTDLAVRLDDMRMCRWIQSWAQRAKLSDPDVGEKVADQIQQAATFRVRADVNAEVYRIAQSLSDDQRVDSVEAPTDYGLLIFEEPLDSKFVGGYSQYFHMISWGRTHLTTPAGDEAKGYTITTWCDANRGVDTATEMLRQRALTIRDGATLKAMQHMTGGFYISNVLVMLDFQQCGRMVTRLSLDEHENAVRNGFDPLEGGKISLARLLMAVWQHMGTPESEPDESEDDEQIHVPRAARKRAQRAGLSGDISVIVMRRPSRKTINPGSGKPLDHQVTRRGHYRNVRCGPGWSERRRVWIPEKTYGPEGAPVVDRARVYDVK